MFWHYIICYVFLEILCPDLTAPENGVVFLSGMAPGDRAAYFCNSGFALEGVVTVICGDDGAWSAGPPVCRRESPYNKILLSCCVHVHILREYSMLQAHMVCTYTFIYVYSYTQNDNTHLYDCDKQCTQLR